MFPRGFIYSSRGISAPAGWAASKVFSGLHFDPIWHHAAAHRGGARVKVIGTCIPIDRAIGDDYNPAADLLTNLLEGEDSFFAKLAKMCGRHVVFWREPSLLRNAPVKIVTDATGMRTVYYNQTLKIIASHARLTAGNEPERPMPHHWGYPGLQTPWPSVRLLSPNTYLIANTCEVQRFYPTRKPEPKSVPVVAAMISEAAKTALRNYTTKYGALQLGLTAGIDSRTTLSLIVGSGVEVPTFTNLPAKKKNSRINKINARRASIDSIVAADIAVVAGMPHRTIQAIGKIAPGRARLFAEASYYPHATAIAETKRLSGDNTTFLSSNLYEIGRAFYHGRRLATPSTPEKAMRLYCKMAKVFARGAVTNVVYQRYVRHAYEDFFERTRFSQACEIFGAYDAHYWEHRMAAWHATMIQVRDFASDTFITINARSIFEQMLSVPLAERKTDAVSLKIIEMNEPRLLSVPINPQDWPPTVDMQSSIAAQREINTQASEAL